MAQGTRPDIASGRSDIDSQLRPRTISSMASASLLAVLGLEQARFHTPSS